MPDNLSMCAGLDPELGFRGYGLVVLSFSCEKFLNIWLFHILCPVCVDLSFCLQWFYLNDLSAWHVCIFCYGCF